MTPGLPLSRLNELNDAYGQHLIDFVQTMMGLTFFGVPSFTLFW